MSTSWSESSEISDSRSSWEATEGEHWELSKEAPLFCSLGSSGRCSQGLSTLSCSFLLLWGFSWMKGRKLDSGRIVQQEGRKRDKWKHLSTCTLDLVFQLSNVWPATIFLIQKNTYVGHFLTVEARKFLSHQRKTILLPDKYQPPEWQCITSSEHLIPAQTHDSEV